MPTFVGILCFLEKRCGIIFPGDTMAFDGLVMHQLCKELQVLVPGKINKIQQISDTEILFTIRAGSTNYKLMISAHSTYNRIHLTNRTYHTMDIPSSFVMVLRKHINGAIIQKIQQEGLDRIITIVLQARNELGDIHTIRMVVELMGKYANIILINDENRVIDAIKRIPPFENSIRTIHPGAVFIPVKAQDGKQDPFTPMDINVEESFAKQFHGFSPLLSTEFHYRLRHGENFSEIMSELSQSHTLYQKEIDGKDYFHLIPLKHLAIEMETYPLQEGMDRLYYEKEEKVRIKEASGDLYKVVRQELKKNRNKLLKLEKTLEDAYDLENYRIYGDLLYAYAYQFSTKQKQVTLPSFETGEDIIIPLDEKLDIKGNAKKYYQKYQKSKTAQIEVAHQIDLTKQTIQYFEILELQLEEASFLDAAEIREELSNLGYMKKKQRSIARKKKQRPNFITLIVEDTEIYIGKNNIQNDYITWKHSRKDYFWFHTKDIHGSHVVVASSQPSENVIRTAAMLAAYYSKARYSSSVPINYCAIRSLRKPNRAALGFVTLTNYKTIYIDPEEQTIKSLLSQLD